MSASSMRDQSSIAILGSRGLPAKYGGFETFTEELSTRLVQAGYRVTVFCEAGIEQQTSEYRDVRLKYVPSPRLGPLTTFLFDFLCLWQARKKYDVVYMLGYGAALFCFIPRLWGREVWINVDGVEWARSKWNGVAKIWFKMMEKCAMWTANRIIADAEGIRDHLSRRHKTIPACTVIPYGAPILEYKPDQSLLNELGLSVFGYYLVVCRLEPENHVWEIISGFLGATTRYPLVIIGNHKTRTSYIQKLLNLRDDRIQFIGTIYDREKLTSLRYYARAYFHGHSVGGTNPSLLEALGCGNIVIAHDNVFNREVAGDTAYYFKHAADIPDIVRKFEALAPEERVKKAQRAREIIRSKYKWEMIAETYAKLLSNGRSSR